MQKNQILDIVGFVAGIVHLGFIDNVEDNIDLVCNRCIMLKKDSLYMNSQG